MAHNPTRIVLIAATAAEQRPHDSMRSAPMIQSHIFWTDQAASEATQFLRGLGYAVELFNDVREPPSNN